MAISSTSKHHPNGILVFDFANWLMLQTHSFLKLLNCLEVSKAFSCHLKEKKSRTKLAKYRMGQTFVRIWPEAETPEA